MEYNYWGSIRCDGQYKVQRLSVVGIIAGIIVGMIYFFSEFLEIMLAK